MHVARQRLPWLGRCYGALALTVAGGLFISAGQAATSPIYISGTITSKPQCVINGNQTIRVEFGDDLVTTKVDGSNYIRQVDYTLECRNNSNNAMKMRIVGTAASFNGSAIQSSKANLAIALRANGSPLTVGSWLNFSYPNKPLLQAVPVKGNGTLTPGAFSAAATLMVDYQ
jgi:type 1 fimbria pilin